MKVTPKNTRLLLYFNLANIAVGSAFIYLLYGEITGPITVIFQTAFFISILLTLYYFVRIILFFREATSVMVAYTMLPIILAFNITQIVFPKLLNYSDWLGTLLLVVTILVAFRSFFVKHPAIRLPFRLFGTGLGLIVIPRLLFLLISSGLHDDVISPLTDIGIALVFFSTLFILKRVSDYFKNYGGEGIEDGAVADSTSFDAS